MVGFCKVEEKEDGPAQRYSTPDVPDVAVRLNVPPVHSGLLLPAAGINGVTFEGLMNTRTVSPEPGQTPVRTAMSATGVVDTVTVVMVPV